MNALETLIEGLSRLPGVGKKSAARMAHHLLTGDQALCRRLAHDLSVLHERIHPCPVCGAWTEEELCSVCSDPSRDSRTLCVVEQPQDVTTIACIREYRGQFHVLGGVIAPLDGIGPEQLRFAELLRRIRNQGVNEVIIATNPTVEGDTTALYIQRILKEHPVSVTRLASGLPVGGDLEYVDRLTLERSFRGRGRF